MSGRKQLIFGMIVGAALKALLTVGLIGIAVFGCGCGSDVNVKHNPQKLDVNVHHDDQRIDIHVHRDGKTRRRQPQGTPQLMPAPNQ